jgi:environmental stress-induced protein Ves
VRLIRVEDYRRMPWKNGGGETTEIAAWPDGAGLETFDWRVSMARVTADGPFSGFPGVDRTLAILDGAGLRLDIAGRHPVELTTTSPPFSFPADLPTVAKLAEGPVLDLNVMTRRDVVEHAVDARVINGRREIDIDSSTVLLHCRRSAVAVETPAGPATLQPDETLLVRTDAAGRWTLTAERPAVVWLIRIRAARAM